MSREAAFGKQGRRQYDAHVRIAGVAPSATDEFCRE
jgi:hypothetical protein